MGRAIQLEPGIWYAGLKRPLLVSRSMVETLLRDALPPPAAAGVQQFQWHEREAEFPPFDPHHAPDYRDDWDEWFSVEYRGDQYPMLVPDALAWVVGVPDRPQPQQQAPLPPMGPPPPPPAPSSSAPSPPTEEQSGAGGGFGLLLLFLLLSMKRNG